MKKLIYILMLGIIAGSCQNDDSVGIDPGNVTSSDFKDPRDGTVYKCITIGGDTWMAENLRYRIPGGYYSGCFRYSEAWGGMSQAQFDDYLEKVYKAGRMTEALYKETKTMRRGGYTPSVLMSMIGYKYPSELVDEILSYDKTYFDNFGYLYTYDALKGAVPPGGWEIPKDEDWKRLEKNLGISDGEAEQIEAWRGNGLADLLQSGEQGVGFNAKYGGGKVYRSDVAGGVYDGKDCRTIFWAADTVDGNKEGYLGIVRSMMINNDKVWRGTTKRTGTAYSVRCILRKAN